MALAAYIDLKVVLTCEGRGECSARVGLMLRGRYQPDHHWD